MGFELVKYMTLHEGKGSHVFAFRSSHSSELLGGYGGGGGGDGGDNKDDERAQQQQQQQPIVRSSTAGFTKNNLNIHHQPHYPTHSHRLWIFQDFNQSTSSSSSSSSSLSLVYTSRNTQENKQNHLKSSSDTLSKISPIAIIGGGIGGVALGLVQLI
jgi:hypothetical protein